jgi:predicted nucleic acid-binding protein
MSERVYLFDTGALLDIYHGRRRVQEHFDRLLAGFPVTYVSTISEAELWRGLRPDELERHETLLAFFVALPLMSDASRLAGQWMRRYEGQGLGWMDALIVATASVAGATVLTRDRRLAEVLAAESEFELYG